MAPTDCMAPKDDEDDAAEALPPAVPPAAAGGTSDGSCGAKAMAAAHASHTWPSAANARACDRV